MNISKNAQKTSQLSNLGRFLDQPKLVENLNKAMPYTLIGGSLLVGANDVFRSSKEEKTNAAIKNLCTLGAVVGSSLIAIKGLKINGKKIMKGLIDDHHEHGHNQECECLGKSIDKYIKKTNIKDENIKNILTKAKTKILSLKELTNLRNHVNQSAEGKKIFNKISPKPDEHGDSKHIFEEMKRLSLLGLIPVAGGIAGGTLGDKLTDKNWKEKFPNKVKEGAYQYLANIFLCNVGAGAALWGLETLSKKKAIKPPSGSTKIGAMVGGVLAVGVLGGSAIANVIGQKIINPLFKQEDKQNNDGIYNERTPDPLDISLHVDDMASIGVLSGFKWVEPALPLLYSVSGYRAGIGYRNHGHHKNGHKQHHEKFRHEHHTKNVNFEHNHQIKKHHLVKNEVFSKFTEKS